MGLIPNTSLAAKLSLPNLNVPPPPLPNLSIPPPSLMTTAPNSTLSMSVSNLPHMNSPVVKNLPSLMSMNPFNQDAVNIQPPSHSIQSSKLAITPLMSIQSTSNPVLKVIPLNIILPMPLVMSNTLESTKPPPIDADIPFYNLPASLMVPLIKVIFLISLSKLFLSSTKFNLKLEDCEYKSLDPKQIKMPPLIVPSEKLLKAVEEFYNIKDKKINE